MTGEDATQLRRFWLEFELDPPPAASGPGVTLDHPLGATRAQMNLPAGVGVTGDDEADCLDQIRAVLLEGDPLPPITRVLPDVDLSAPQFAAPDRLGTAIWEASGSPP